jgi:hypothetical protein
LSALNRPGILRRLHRDERGAVATIFAILLASGVLLGVLALVVDIGLLYAEREELQSGADAAVIAVAQRCALPDADECDESDLETLAATFAEANARDGFADVLEVCGNLPGFAAECDPPVGNLTDCMPATPTDGRPYVEVRTRTQTTSEDDDKFLLPPVFAQTLAGNGDYDGTTVRACARATIGTPGYGLGVTFAQCEFDDAVPDLEELPLGTAFVTGEHREVVLKVHDGKAAPPAACKDEPIGGSGFDLPGGFGWLDDINSQCEVTFINGTYDADTGADTPSECLARLEAAANNPETVLYLPIYETAFKDGKRYTAARIAAFVPTGYFFGAGGTGGGGGGGGGGKPGGGGGPTPKSNDSWLPGSTATCKGDERCIFGYFVNVTTSGPLGPADLESLGATVIALSG